MLVITLLCRRNEELDDKVVIQKLKQRVMQLERELATVTERTTSVVCPTSPAAESVVNGGVATSFDRPLTTKDKKLCHKVLYEFLHSRTDDPVTAG